MSRENCHPNYYEEIYLPWIRGDKEVERSWQGVHEFTPAIRGESFTREFLGDHPTVIANKIDEFKELINETV